MRRQLVRMLICLLAFLAAVAAINLVANPYGAWPTALIDRTYLKIGLGVERMSTPYRVRSEAPVLLLVGTSRVLYGMWIEQGSRDGVLNGGLSGASLDEATAVVDLGLRNPRLRRIIWSVDFPQFSERLRGFRDRATQTRLAGDAPLLVRETLLSLDALQASGQLLMRAAGGRSRLPAQRLLPIPWPAADVRAAFDTIASGATDDVGRPAIELHVREWLAIYAQYQRSDAQWDLFRRTVDRIGATGIELTLVVPPLNVFELEAVRQAGAWPAFQAWKRELVSVGPYWDFSGYNQMARHDELYMFPTFCHFKPAVGHTMLRRVLGGDCSQCGALAQTVIDAGVWVDQSTLEAHLADEDAALLAFVHESPTSLQVVEGQLAQPPAPAVTRVSANPEGDLIPLP
jgi:hypothetical protein